MLLLPAGGARRGARRAACLVSFPAWRAGGAKQRLVKENLGGWRHGPSYYSGIGFCKTRRLGLRAERRRLRPARCGTLFMVR